MQHNKYCPLIKGGCYEGLCAFSVGEQCGITAIAECLKVRAAQGKSLEKSLDKGLDYIANRINGVWGELRDR